MSEYKDVIKALVSKLQKDRKNTEWEDGSENLNYILEARLQQDIVDGLLEADITNFPKAVALGSVVAAKYVDWLITLDNE